jgi:hypothetical protein
VGKLGEDKTETVEFHDLKNIVIQPASNLEEEKVDVGRKYAHITTEMVDSSSSSNFNPNYNNSNTLDISASLLNFREPKNNNNFFDTKAIIYDNRQLLGSNLVMPNFANSNNP